MKHDTISVSPSGRPRFEFLMTRNFLSEYNSEVDKARVRQNLGIPDDYNLYWGNIKGNLQNQSDLMTMINSIKSGFDYKINNITGQLSALNNIVVANDSSMNIIKNIALPLENVASEILTMKTDIAQNSALIAQISNDNDDLLDLIDSLNSQITTLTIRNEILQSQINDIIRMNETLYPSYIGFGSGIEQIFEGSAYRVQSITGEWSKNEIPKYNNVSLPTYKLWIATVRPIQHIYQNNESIDFDEEQLLVHSGNQLIYRIYKLSYDNNANIIIVTE